ncbi:MAG: hypothetical protein HZB17_09165 [Chloroflexi bacterium]|nr:hypothetical protein [Chloroflexota bacterium]
MQLPASFIWDVIKYAMTFGGDIIVGLTFLSALSILLGVLLPLHFRRRVQRWEAFVVGFFFSFIGWIVKLGDTSGLPTGMFLQLSNVSIGVLLFLSVLIVLSSIVLTVWRKA